MVDDSRSQTTEPPVTNRGVPAHVRVNSTDDLHAMGNFTDEEATSVMANRTGGVMLPSDEVGFAAASVFSDSSGEAHHTCMRTHILAGC